MLTGFSLDTPVNIMVNTVPGRAGRFAVMLSRMMIDAAKLPTTLREFVDSVEWTFAKTMPEWPHEYLVRDRVDTQLFEALVRHIREHGDEGRFYRRVLIYFAEDGLLYWTMGGPVEEETIINRCMEEESFENRLKNGTLPEDKRSHT